MKYIETFRDGEKVGDIYLCKSKTSAVTKNGKPYDSVILQDKTGTIDAKIWDPNSLGIDDFDALDYVDVVGDGSEEDGVTVDNTKTKGFVIVNKKKYTASIDFEGNYTVKLKSKLYSGNKVTVKARNKKGMGIAKKYTVK